MAAFEGVAFLWVVVETHFFPQQKMKKKTPLPTPFSPHFTPPPPVHQNGKISAYILCEICDTLHGDGTPRGPIRPMKVRVVFFLLDFIFNFFFFEKRN